MQPFNKLFSHHEQQLLQVVRTKATGLRSTFDKSHPQMKTAAEEEVSGLVNMTTNNRVQFEVRPSDAETNGTIGSIADMNRVESQLQTEI